jgi:effector-binding domain-containing protein
MSSQVQIIDKPLHIDVYGYSGVKTSTDANFGAAAFRIMGDMWTKIKNNNIKHKGKNIWVYEGNDKMFTGLELENDNGAEAGLEKKEVRYDKYLYYKHIGPYSKLSEAYATMQAEINRQGLQPVRPFLEIYGHWTNDESKLETELIYGLK